jgi:hypothetical protein
VFYGWIECFKFLFLNHCEVSESVCESSVRGENLEIIQISEHEHGDFRKCLKENKTLLRWAAQFGQTEFASFLTLNGAEIISTLLS